LLPQALEEDGELAVPAEEEAGVALGEGQEAAEGALLTTRAFALQERIEARVDLGEARPLAGVLGQASGDELAQGRRDLARRLDGGHPLAGGDHGLELGE